MYTSVSHCDWSAVPHHTAQCTVSRVAGQPAAALLAGKWSGVCRAPHLRRAGGQTGKGSSESTTEPEESKHANMRMGRAAEDGESSARLVQSKAGAKQISSKVIHATTTTHIL